MTSKECRICHQIKPLNKFPVAPTCKDGYDSVCYQCRSNQAMKRYYERRAKGLCVQCGAIALPDGLYCLDHWFAQVARDRLGNRRMGLAKQLKQLWLTQKKRCPYTDQELIPGQNMHLDHIKPVSHFPELQKSFDNLQWVASEVNRAKANLTHEEFVSLCRRIVRHCSI